jgi:manganese transport protein
MATAAPSAASTMVGADGRPRLLRRWGMRLGLLGPAFVAAVAYVDPGNVAANLQAGSGYGFALVWVLVLATACAGVVQFLSAKVGVVSGRSLPELMADRLGRRSRTAYWLQAESVALATDLAEVVGAAVALRLLFGLPLVLGGVIAGAVSMLLLLVRDRRGQKPFERTVVGLLLIIAIGFLAGLFVAPPAPGEVLGGLLPTIPDGGAVVLAAAMLGATVMPHVVYLHSALSRDRFAGALPERTRGLLRSTRVDVIGAMLLAGAVNIAMLLLAASALRGHSDVNTLDGAHSAISGALGPVIGVLFAVGLLVSGLASTSVGSQAGNVVMAGLLRRNVPQVWRRLLTLVPALVLLACGAEPTMVLVISQVVLSFGLPLVLFPLVRLSSDRAVMGDHANGPWTRRIGWVIGIAVSALNVALLVCLATGAG